jgi:hypothetical protein
LKRLLARGGGDPAAPKGAPRFAVILFCLISFSMVTALVRSHALFDALELGFVLADASGRGIPWGDGGKLPSSMSLPARSSISVFHSF